MIKLGDVLDVDDEYLVDEEELSVEHIKLQRQTPWIDKYRPDKLSDVIYQDEVVKILQDTLKHGKLQHLLFYGPPGTGKTSTILAVAKELFGPRVYNDRVIELNASDERGISVVRNKIITFARTTIGSRDPNYLCPPYKIIILDEADAMTTEAQSALRKTMEDYSDITRFCFICNYINQIIDPITSRCAKFRFKPLNEDNMIQKLYSITQNEGLNIKQDALKVVAKISDGDMRKAIMLLQNLQYAVNDDNEIRSELVYETANCADLGKLREIENVCITNKRKNPKAIVKLTLSIKNSGYPIYTMLDQIHKHIINNNILTDKMKSIIAMHLSNTEKRLIDGADEFTQLLSVFMCIKSVSLGIDSIYLKN